jgi:Na+/H+ antiporter NhaC
VRLTSKIRNLLLFTKISPTKFHSSNIVFLKIKKFCTVMGALGLEFVAYENFQIWVRGGIILILFSDLFFHRNYFFIEDYSNCVKISAHHYSHPQDSCIFL